METVLIVNYVIMALFFACYAYQFFYIPAALVCKSGWKPITHSKCVSAQELICVSGDKAP